MISSALGSEESLTYADHLLAPLYKVSEGFNLLGKSLVACVNSPVGIAHYLFSADRRCIQWPSQEKFRRG